jgi:hypothetical protein
MMFYPVKILTPDLKLKKTISSNELSKIHWKTFYNSEDIKRIGNRKYKLSMKRKRALENNFSEPEIHNRN